MDDLTGAAAAADEDEDLLLASFLESELLSSDAEEEEEGKGNLKEEGEDERPLKKQRVERTAQIHSGIFSCVPPELFHHIFKFLSSEDLISCVLVCRFMSLAASDETLWRRLYCMRWGPSSSPGNFRTTTWKKLYIQRDKEDMVEFVRNTPTEFKEYFIQMQVSKRSQSPLLSHLSDDSLLLHKSISDQVSQWKSKKGFSTNIEDHNNSELIRGHNCNGNLCTYAQIGDVFICEKTGRVHVCDETCREVVLDLASGNLVCVISGHCFDRWLFSDEEESDEIEPDQQQAGGGDESEPFMGSGRFARAYLLGYNCADEKELEATLRFC